jgi:Na+/H+-dicarboxylate symporter
MLALIFVAILLGVGTVVAGEAGKPLAALFQSASRRACCASSPS